MHRLLVAVALLLAACSAQGRAPTQDDVRVSSPTCATVESVADPIARRNLQRACRGDPEIGLRVVTCRRDDSTTFAAGSEEELAQLEADARAACSARAQPPQRTTWVCAGGSRFEVVIHGGAAAAVSAGGQNYLLGRTTEAIADEGEVFADETVRYNRSDDSKAGLTGAAGGPYLDCSAE